MRCVLGRIFRGSGRAMAETPLERPDLTDTEARSIMNDLAGDTLVSAGSDT